MSKIFKFKYNDYNAGLISMFCRLKTIKDDKIKKNQADYNLLYKTQS